MTFRYLALATVAGCASAPTPSTAPSPIQLVVPPLPAVSVEAASPAKSPPPRLRFEKHDDGMGGSKCSVIDDATGKVIGQATSQNTAAGGSTIECYDFLAEGKIIRFINSRGLYAKDARPGADDAQSLMCGDGVFANDLSTCVRLDTASQLYDSSDASTPSAPFDIQLCATAKAACTTLLAVPRGMNRVAGPATYLPRWWDAKYCTDTRVLVVADGVLRLFDAPSGKLLARAAAPGAVSIERCEGGTAVTRSEKNEARSFRVTDTIAVTP